MNLWEFEDKQIKVTTVSGRVFIGFGDHYVSELDNPDGVATLSLARDGCDTSFIEFTADEITSIELISGATPLAKAV
ncbi:MAG: hypothetical protein FWB96_12320 [Defluviitaleaceae bacterium]|nr:hypothetical protein [Defluviitaleaceae bacterium]MCL2264258.1 hypothetical protein [Defluviitaleaceae bacterium]